MRPTPAIPPPHRTPTTASAAPHRPEVPKALHRRRRLRTGNIGRLGRDADEAANEAALAILGHHLGGDWPRAWRLVDAFEREFLAALNVRDEISIDAATGAPWVAAREKSG